MNWNQMQGSGDPCPIQMAADEIYGTAGNGVATYTGGQYGRSNGGCEDGWCAGIAPEIATNTTVSGGASARLLPAAAIAQTTNGGSFDTEVATTDEGADMAVTLPGIVPPIGDLPDSGVVPPIGDLPDSGVVPPIGDLPDSGVVPPIGDLPDSGIVPPIGNLPDSGIELPIGDLPDFGIVPPIGTLPGQVIGVGSCFGRDSTMYLDQIRQYIDAELALRQSLLVLAQRSPRFLSRLRTAAAKSLDSARKLATVYYLISGSYYWPQRVSGTTTGQSFSRELRRQFETAQALENAYRVDSGHVWDRCLGSLYSILGDVKVTQIGEIFSILSTF